jgi:2-octaprenyl-6-methoxyphenol hydroxylase
LVATTPTAACITAAPSSFFATGPLAMLPMLGQRSSIVWAADDRLARADRARRPRVRGQPGDRPGDRYGALELAGPRWHYPRRWFRRPATARRLALVGDAARERST